ncbi:PA2169 family four-helix-bundle protein [Flavobacterium sp. ST-87]|uniref:PA2169 family four-helix-bundle protein n=1 Tax=Flavobacterium plantiphilum TaxID=3163297 RepID=A0ABW8XT00_9FLAO
MEKYTADLKNKLNNLLERIHDGEKGFKKASTHTDHQFLRKFFEKKSLEREKFSHELNNVLNTYEVHDDNSGSVAGAAHRAWMEIKSLFSFDNEESMLEEAINGEKVLLDDYNDILSVETVPIGIRAVLLNHKELIENGLDAIKKLEDLRD